MSLPAILVTAGTACAVLGATLDPRYFLAAGILLGVAAVLYEYDHRGEGCDHDRR